MEYILRDRCWECIKYSALVRPASEAGTGAATNYGSGNGSSRRSRHDVGDEAAYKYADLEEIFKEVAAEAYEKFVKQSVSEAAQLGWTDALALLRCELLICEYSFLFRNSSLFRFEHMLTVFFFCFCF